MVSQVLFDPLDEQLDLQALAEQVRNFDPVDLVIDDVNGRGKVASQVQQCVEFDIRLVIVKRRRCVDRRAQIYLGGIKYIDYCVKFNRQQMRKGGFFALRNYDTKYQSEKCII